MYSIYCKSYILYEKTMLKTMVDLIFLVISTVYIYSTYGLLNAEVSDAPAIGALCLPDCFKNEVP